MTVPVNVKNPLERMSRDPGYAGLEAFRIAWQKGEFTYGDIIPREWLEEAMSMSKDGLVSPIELSEYRGKWMRAVGTFRNHLLNEMRALVVAVSNPPGYYIVRPEEQTPYAVHSFSRSVQSAARKSNEIADNTNLEVLTAEQKREASDQRAMLRRMQQATAAVTRSTFNVRGGRLSKSEDDAVEE